MVKRKLRVKTGEEAISGAKKRKTDHDNSGTSPTKPNPELTHDAYTIGWICAISTEYVAAQVFLDERHKRPEYLSSNDNNDYTLGKIGEHNVVIAVLPNGEYGTATAASVAKDILRSFPNVKIGLMVGIGGGAPSLKHDIRLGDIVVSVPRDGTGGVFQYDFGKTIQNQSFQHSHFLNQPPMSLGTAVNGLRAQYEINGHRLEEDINRILEIKPKLRKRYKRPDASNDRLYRSRVVHPANEARCAEVCGDDPSNLILRPKRTEDEDNPAIHYGLIASANQLMKDALVRDKLSAEKGVLCFEMEAAGLMNQYPFLIIRGICDYSDSHKNDEWQGYAAMAAAAYAKDLLHRIPPSKVEAEKKIIEIVSSGMNELRSATQATTAAVQRLDIEHRQGKIEQWLAPPDPSLNYKNALQQRHEGSGTWFIESEKFLNWTTQRKSFLWLYGIPGCGKTILSSTTIQYLVGALSSPLLYFYFGFNDTSKQTLESMVRSLIAQLYFKREDTRHFLDSLFTSCETGRRQPTLGVLCQVFLHMLAQVNEVWVVLDALDECCTRNGSSTEGILSWIRDLLNSDQRNVHLLVTSRLEQDIQAEFDEWASSENRVAIQSNLITDDISVYIRRRVKEDKGLMRWHSRRDVQEEIETTLTERADGMFRWVACQLDALMDCYDYDDLQHALAHLPRTLDETYSRILESISAHEKHKLKAIKILQLLAFSERPLHLHEVVDAIVVDTKKRPHFDEKRRMPNPQEVARYCKSLVFVSRNNIDSTPLDLNHADNLVLQLAHFSVKEYLISDRVHQRFFEAFQEATARASIAAICTAYLLHLDRDLKRQEIQKKFPFAEYCARYWLEHAAERKGKGDEAHGLIMKLFNCEAALRNWLQLYDGKYRTGPKEPIPPLYYASRGGLEYEVEALIAMGEDVNARCGAYGNALPAASARGNTHIVKLLLAGGANVNAPGAGYSNALHGASHGGHEHIVKLLLDSGADVNGQDGVYGNALAAASARGHGQIVELLLVNGADVNIADKLNDSALIVASAEGYEQIVELLLDSGADVNASSIDSGTALQEAAGRGHGRIVKLLLDNGADVNTPPGDLGTALQRAAGGGHEQIVKLLLDNGADVNSGDPYGNALIEASTGGHAHIMKLLLGSGADVNSQGEEGSALIIASAEGYKEIVELLLDNGADINTAGGFYGSALAAASMKGHEEIVELLLDSGADVNNQDKENNNALAAASVRGHKEIVELLLDSNADVNGQGEMCSNALAAASAGGHKEIVELLLDNGADVNAPPGGLGTALQRAAGGGHESIMKLLLDSGADVNNQDKENNNALAVASAEGHKQIVELLLDSGADVNAPPGNLGTALQRAAGGGHEQIVKLLLDNGTDVNTPPGERGSALQRAAGRGYEQIVQLLLDNGADVNAPPGNLGTALQRAAGGGHEQIVKLLLDNGADVNTPPGKRGSALQRAAGRGYEQIVKLLLDSGANVNSDDEYSNALIEASTRGHEHIVKLLLGNGADINAAGGFYGSALTGASAGGYKQIVKLLLESSVNIDAASGFHGSALITASAGGYKQIVKLLLESGADVNTAGGSYGNALTAASAEGYEPIVKLLLEGGADINARSEKYDNALTAASSRGYKHIVKTLRAWSKLPAEN